MKNISEVFFKKIILIPFHDCWEWSGCRMKSNNKDGKFNGNYGRLIFKGKHWLAHRLSYFIHSGELKKKDCVLHKCDNPGCVNPRHLFIGSREDNVRDMISKNRNKGVARNTNGAKINPYIAREIKSAYLNGTMTQIEVGKMFNVSQMTVSLISRDKIWGDL